MKLQNAIDSVSAFGENCGLALNKFFAKTWRIIDTGITFVIFGVCIGFTVHFFRGLAGKKV